MAAKEKRQQKLKDVATMEEEMRVAQMQIEQRKRQAQEVLDKQEKRLKIVTPGRPDSTPIPRTPSRSRFGL